MNITVLGIGMMGLPMAQRLREAGFAVTAWNRTVEKAMRLASHGARVAHTAAQAVREADVVITMLENGDTVEAVLFGQGVAQVLKPGTLVIDMSSIKPAQARDHARRPRRGRQGARSHARPGGGRGREPGPA
jgi:3-hydroxyisobutyrate dehydrogenase-like beta-hydroxyacid dehydrogenase